jgi:hypothetical protein
MKERETPNYRAVLYLCYMPRKLCNDKNLTKKQEAFNNLRTTSHWPCKIKLFPKYPQTYGNELPKITIINKPIIHDIGLTLAGF